MNAKSAEMLGSFSENMNKQIAKLTELNTRALGKVTQRTELLNGLIQAKKPEDFIAVQMKLSATTAADTIQYLQELSGILLEGVSHTTQQTSANASQASTDKTSTSCNVKEKA
jgi:hypothetical protein